MKRKKNTGFTLNELMITLAAGAILMSAAVPAFQGLVANAEMTSATNLLLANLSAARSEAVTRNLPVSVCASFDQSTCSGDNSWGSGWIVFTDPDNPGVRDSGEELIHVAQPVDDTVSLETPEAYVRFGSLGEIDLQ